MKKKKNFFQLFYLINDLHDEKTVLRLPLGVTFSNYYYIFFFKQYRINFAS